MRKAEIVTEGAGVDPGVVATDPAAGKDAGVAAAIDAGAGTGVFLQPHFPVLFSSLFFALIGKDVVDWLLKIICSSISVFCGLNFYSHT